ncbi:MAG: DUF72 domain-containing protein [Saprospiraceae bacterium]|nr:DUF72 domain-containing protein [Saprospiraceae bacterium]
MEFGKLQDISQVDFRLPPDAPLSWKALRCGDDVEPAPVLYIGCTGWGMPEWVGTVYPTGAKPKDFLRHYSRQFNTIEHNTTHYRIPTPETVTKWREETPADFRFCPKIPQIISHSGDLGLGGEALRQFCEVIAQLDDKLGCCFLQLPPYFGPEKMPVISQFAARFPKHIPLALEVRHPAWFADTDSAATLFHLLESEGISTVLTDVAGRRDVLHMRLTSPTVLIRFVGNGLHPSDYSRCDEWIRRLRTWYDNGLKEVYFFTHEPDNLLAPQLAQYLWQHAATQLEVQVRGPSWQDRQMSLF